MRDKSKGSGKTTTQNKSNRREFLKQSFLGLASISIVPSYVLGGACGKAPSDKITMGFIGTGKQSFGLGSAFLNLDDIKMIAACDVDSVKVGKFKEMVNKHYAEVTENPSYDSCDMYAEYNDLIARDDIDAVVICLPDHWHAIPSIQALKLGKDVYCEKPLSHTIEEGRAMVKATRDNKRVFQTGNMQRSWGNFRKACELVRNGYIGEIKTVQVNVGGPPVPCDLPDQPTPDTIDWDKWIGPAPYRGYHDILSPPYPIEIWPQWRRYSEFGGGGVTDWGAHMFDIVQWALGKDDSGPVTFIPPTTKGADRGLKFIYDNGIEVTHEDFGRGFAVRFHGTDGTIDISRDFFEASDPTLVEKELSSSDTKLYHSDNHYQDFIDAIKSRNKPVSDVEIGHRTATVCNIANITYQLGRTLNWDPVKEEFANDTEANRLRGKEYRKPYVLT